MKKEEHFTPLEYVKWKRKTHKWLEHGRNFAEKMDDRDDPGTWFAGYSSAIGDYITKFNKTIK